MTSCTICLSNVLTHLGCWHFGDIIERTAINTCEQACLRTYVFIFLEEIPRSRLLGHRRGKGSNFQEGILPGKMAGQISKKRKPVADGTFKARLNEFLTQELAEDSYSGAEVRVIGTGTEIIISATRMHKVFSEKGWWI